MKLYYTLIFALLVGCGGGGGDSTSTVTNPDTIPDTVFYSSDYSTDELNVFFTLSGTGSTEAVIRGYIQDKSFNYVTLNGSDELFVHVDGTPFKLNKTQQETVNDSGSYGGEFYEVEVTSLATEYTVSLVRNNVEVAHLVATELPVPFEPVVSCNDPLNLEAI